VTNRLCAGLAAAWLAASATLAAANVWESKPFHTWTDKELEKVLTSSPWAGKGSLKYVQNRANQQPLWETAMVTWASSRVIRQALVREEFGATPDVSQEAAAVIAQTPPFYLVTVRITNAVNSSSRAGQAQQMLNETYLVPRGKPPIPATQAEGEVLDLDGQAAPSPAADGPRGARGPGTPALAASPGQRSGGGAGAGAGGQRGTGGAGTGGAAGVGAAGRGRTGGARGRGVNEPRTTAALVTFRFPRDPVTLQDKEVEFVTKLCGGGGFGGRGGGAPVPLGGPNPGGLQFEMAAGQQRGGGLPIPGSGPNVRMGDPLPACNIQVKKTFKLKDMVVKGELLL
jgi:hypothetical protein